ncbi:Protein rad9 [Smittium mucronatum]|uniref:Sister chromatid cohesion protein n=1 Tax=Smittium mucronatum TaxID=133383 RepID=A0A1R0H110_9FUNG|nr:Protein rad9 [Smittium mucronatum]
MVDKVKLSLESNYILVRTKALKALGTIASKNPKILALNVIKPVVKTRLRDISPLVREAAMDMLGKFIFSDMDIMKLYFKTICSRTVDKGAIVRRKVLKILKEIYYKADDFQYQVEICFLLLSRIKDDDKGVRELSLKTLKEILKNTYQKNLLSSEASKENDSNDFSEKLISSCKNGQSNSSERSHVLIQSEKPSLNSNENYVNYAELPVAIQKNVSHSVRVISSALTLGKGKNAETKENLKAFLKCLCNDQSEDIAISENNQGYDGILMMADIAFDLLLNIQVNESETSKSDDLKDVTEYQVKGLASFCIKRLLKNKEVFEKKEESRLYIKETIRLLMLINLLVRNFPFKNYLSSQKNYFQEIDSLIYGMDLSNFALDLTLFFTGHDQPLSVRTTALQMIGQIQMSYPEFMMTESVKILYDSTFKEPEIILKRQLLKNFINFLRLELFQPSKKPDSHPKESVIDEVDSLVGYSLSNDNGMSASLIQTYLENIIETVNLSKYNSNDDVGFEILSLILTQGLAHPLKCIPVLISIESLPNSPLRKTASKIHLDLSIKYDSFIHSLDSEGIKLAYEKQLEVCDSNHSSVVGYCLKKDWQDNESNLEAVLQPLYDTVTAKKTSQLTFISNTFSIIKSTLDINSDCDYNYTETNGLEIFFDELDDQECLTQKTEDYEADSPGTLVNLKDKKTELSNLYNRTVPFIRYLAENLATFQQSNVEEILIIAKEISHITSNIGVSLLHRFESLNPLRNKVKNIDESEIFSTSLKSDTILSVSVGILVILRESLKSIYKISEHKCNSFSKRGASPNRDKANCNLQLSLVDHWTMFGYSHESQTIHSLDHYSEYGDLIVPCWKAWPFALKEMISDDDYSKQRLLYTQLLSDSTSVYNPLYF